MPNEEQARDGALPCLTPDPTGGGTESRGEPPTVGAEPSDKELLSVEYLGWWNSSSEDIEGAQADGRRALYNAGRASRDREVEELRAALLHFVNQMDSFRESDGNQAEAYYHFVKWQDAFWDRARAALARHAKKEAGDE